MSIMFFTFFKVSPFGKCLIAEFHCICLLHCFKVVNFKTSVHEYSPIGNQLCSKFIAVGGLTPVTC